MGVSRRAGRSHVSYIDRSREFYAAQGYSSPYEWACHDEVPFTPLAGHPGELRVGVVTTAFPVTEGGGTKAAYRHPADPVPRAMYTADLSWDKEATHTDDVGSFLPLEALVGAVGRGLVGSASPAFYGVPTEYSRNKTVERDAPRVIEWCRQDEVDLVLLVPL